MSNYKEKFIAKLKEIPEIKEDMEKLEFGCKVRYGAYVLDYIDGDDKVYFVKGKYLREDGITEMTTKPDEIIGTLKRRYLEMYCESKGIWFITSSKGTMEDEFGDFIYRLNNLRDFDQQDDSVYKEILKFLER